MSVKLSKDTSDVIAQPLANIFNLSLQTGIFPDDWKIAKILPVFIKTTKEEYFKRNCPMQIIAKTAGRLLMNF